MKTAEEIQNELAYDEFDSDWNELSLVEQWSLSDEVAKRYATEAIKADRERVAENAKTMEAVRFTIIDGKLSRYTEKSVDKKSILNLPIELP